MDVHIHPLVLFNISDHSTRERALGRSTPIIGALLGTQTGCKIEIHNCFELVRNENPSRLLCEEFFDTRRKLYLEVFPNYEIVGYYSTSSLAESALGRDEFQTLSQSTNSLLVLVDASKEEDFLTVYDSTRCGSNVSYSALKYSIDTAEAERIAVDHVNNNASNGTSDYSNHVCRMENSVTMLNDRVAGLLEYLAGVKQGRVGRNRKVLKECLLICNSLQSSWGEQDNNELKSEQQDALLCVYYAFMTKMCGGLNNFVDTCNGGI